MATTTGGRFCQKDPQKCISQTGFGLSEKLEKKAQVGGKPIFGGPPVFKNYKVPKPRGTRSQLKPENKAQVGSVEGKPENKAQAGSVGGKPENKAQAGSVGGEPIFGGAPTFKDYNVPKLQGTRSQHQFGYQFPTISFKAIAKNGYQFPTVSFAAIAKNGKPFQKPT